MADNIGCVEKGDCCLELVAFQAQVFFQSVESTVANVGPFHPSSINTCAVVATAESVCLPVDEAEHVEEEDHGQDMPVNLSQRSSFGCEINIHGVIV